MKKTLGEKLTKEEEIFSSVQVFGLNNPASIESIAPAPIVAALDTIPEEMWSWDEEDFDKNVEPTATMRRLRISFWHAYNRALESGKPMRTSDIHAGICHQQYLQQRIIAEPARLAFILKPPVQYAMMMEEALSYSITRVREILSLPIVEGGKVNVRLAALILKSMELLDARLNGLAVQKIESKSLQVNVDAQNVKGSDMLAIDERIKQLQGMLAPRMTTADLDHLTPKTKGAEREVNASDIEGDDE